MINIILYTLIVGVFGTGLGGFIGSLFKKESNKTMSLLLSFAGGIMISIVCFDLLPSSILMGGIYITLFSTIVGVIVVYLLNKYIDIITTKKKLSLTKLFKVTLI